MWDKFALDKIHEMRVACRLLSAHYVFNQFAMNMIAMLLKKTTHCTKIMLSRFSSRFWWWVWVRVRQDSESKLLSTKLTILFPPHCCHLCWQQCLSDVMQTLKQSLKKCHVLQNSRLVNIVGHFHVNNKSPSSPFNMLKSKMLTTNRLL